MLAEVEAMLGALGGQYESEQFKDNRALIELILRAHMQLPRNQVRQLNLTPGADNTEAVQWYVTNFNRLMEILGDEGHRANELSPTERRYGVDILTVSLTTVKFPPEVEDAQQDEKEAKLRARATETYNAVAQKIKKEFPNLTDRERSNIVASILQEGVETQVLNVQGDAGFGTLAAAIEKLARRKP